MDKEQFKERTQSFALRVINLVEALPKDQTTEKVIGKQLLRSGTSVGANYRAACRAKSTAELITKLNITLESADESLYWMELIVKAKLVDSNKLQNLMQEANEIVSMLVASLKTLRSSNWRLPIVDLRLTPAKKTWASVYSICNLQSSISNLLDSRIYNPN
ncbi:four helix bundle protein [Nostoc sp.]